MLCTAVTRPLGGNRCEDACLACLAAASCSRFCSAASATAPRCARDPWSAEALAAAAEAASASRKLRSAGSSSLFRSAFFFCAAQVSTQCSQQPHKSEHLMCIRCNSSSLPVTYCPVPAWPGSPLPPKGMPKRQRQLAGDLPTSTASARSRMQHTSQKFYAQHAFHACRGEDRCTFFFLGLNMAAISSCVKYSPFPS